jgi:hypothetical protein
MLSVVYAQCRKQDHYAECHNAREKHTSLFRTLVIYGRKNVL